MNHSQEIQEIKEMLRKNNFKKEMEMKMRGRPKKEIAFDAEVVKQFIERLFNIEREIRTLKQDKEELREEFKDKVDMKLVANVIRLVKIHLKMTVSDETVQQLEDVIKEKINMVVD